ncbi:BatD family protein [Pollutibacter soli]|uniref:BatD family protein n=1 Tax=Pollutibacter soli TaxID=3034157 RepID=UPI00301372AF
MNFYLSPRSVREIKNAALSLFEPEELTGLGFIMRYFLQLVFLVTCLFYGRSVGAQTKFRVIADKNIVAIDDYIRVQFHLDNAEDVTSFTPPVFNDFIKVQGPEQITGQLTINGAVNHYTSFGYILKPVKKGRFMLPPAKAVVDGKLFQSPSLSIVVNDHGAPKISVDTEDENVSLDEFILRKNETAKKKIQENVFVKLDVNKKSVFVGEPIVATYKLYTRLNSESRITRRPSLNGFSVVDMIDPESRDVYNETWHGKEYNVYILRKAQLFPLQEGEFELESMDVENTVSFIREDFAGDEKTIWRKLKTVGEEGISPEAWTRETVSLSSLPVTINVKPLPPVTTGNNFNGAVGVFRIDAEIPEQKIHEGDVVNLQLTVNGSGNLPLLGSPEINWPENIETYDVKIREQVDYSSTPVSGKKIFTIPFSPTKMGRLDLPPISLTSFNPATAAYATSASKPISIVVLPPAKKPAKKPEAVKRVLQSEKPVPASWIAVTVFVALALIFIVFRLYQRRKAPIMPFPEKALNEVPTALAPVIVPQRIFVSPDDARPFLENGESSDFYRTLDRSIRRMLNEQFAISRLESPEQIERKLLKLDVSANDAADLRHILEDCEISSYSPVVLDEKMKDDFDRAADLMKKLQEKDPVSR